MVTYAVYDDITPKIDGNGKAFSLRSRDYKAVQVVVMEMKEEDKCKPLKNNHTAQGQNQINYQLYTHKQDK